MRILIVFFVLISIASTGPLAFAQDDISKKYIDLLEKNAQLKEELQILKVRIAELESKIEASPESKRTDRKIATTDEKELNDPLPKGLVLKGKFYDEQRGKKTTSSAKLEVIERDIEGKTVTFLTTWENGAIWEFDCKVVGDKSLPITAVRRVRAANAVVNDPQRPPVGGVSGHGSIGTKHLILEFVWREADKGPLSGKFVLDRNK